MKIIEAEGLTKVYAPSIVAVDGVSFSVEEGEIFGFLGASFLTGNEPISYTKETR